MCAAEEHRVGPGPSWPQQEVIMSFINTAMQAGDAQGRPPNPSTVRTWQEFILNLNWTKLKHAPLQRSQWPYIQ